MSAPIPSTDEESVVDDASGGDRLERENWGILAGLAAIVFLGLGPSMNSLGLFAGPIGETFQKSSGDTSALATIFLFTFYAAGPVVGWFVDLGRPRPAMLLGASVAGLSYVWAGYTRSFPQLQWAFGLGGLGVGLSTFAPGAAILVRRFKRHLAFAIGTLVASGAAAGALLPPVIAYGITMNGWRAAIRDVGWTMLIGTVPLILWVLRDPAMWVAIQKGRAAREVAARYARAGIRSAAFWLVCLVFALSQLGVFGAYVTFVPFATSLGYTLDSSGWMFGLMNVFSATGCFAAGTIADRFGAKPVLLASLAVNFLCILMVIATKDPNWRNVTMFAFILCWGLVQGLPSQLCPVVLAKSVEERAYGTLSGTMMLLGGLFGSLGPWMAGAVRDETGSYLVAMLASGGAILLAAPFLAALKIRESHT